MPVKSGTLFTLNIETGMVVLGTNAIFCKVGNPGPEIKKANASLKPPPPDGGQAKAGVYSSELKT